MEDFILSLLLWVGYICVVSWLRYNPALATKPTLVPTTTTVSEVEPCPCSTATETANASEAEQSSTSMIVPVDTSENSQSEAPDDEQAIQNPENKQPETVFTIKLEAAAPASISKEQPASPQFEINSTKTHVPTIKLIEDLKYLEARKVASQLNIRQKVNGVNKKLDFLQREICQKLQSTPEQVTSVVTQIIAAQKPRASRVQTSLAQKLPA